MIKLGRGKSAFLFIVMISTIVLVGIPEQTSGSRFVIAAWNPNDGNGQGIYGVIPYSNITGAFLQINNPETGIGFCYPENTTTYHLNYTPNTALRFDVRVLFNYSLMGLTHPQDNITGRDFIRVSVSMFKASELVGSKNLTYDNLWGYVETGIWYYSYVGVVNVILDPASIYTVVIYYEIFS